MKIIIHLKSLSKIITLLSLFCFTAFANPKYITPSDDYHIVKKGDTIYSISKKYGISVEKLKAINNLKSDTILVWQKIYLKPRKANQQYYVTKRNIPKCGYHIVKKGETLYRIHKLYDIPIEKLMDYNHLAFYTIKGKQKIWLKENKSSKVQDKQEVEQHSKIVKAKFKEDKSVYKKYDIIWPYDGEVISPFGMRNGKPHKGIDIKGPVGQPIKAVLDGTVAYVGIKRGYGNVIIIKHKHGLMTVYAHNQLNYVHTGDIVEKGDKIATIGQTGNATCPHIHFETRINGKAIDPMNFLK